MKPYVDRAADRPALMQLLADINDTNAHEGVTARMTWNEIRSRTHWLCFNWQQDVRKRRAALGLPEHAPLEHSTPRRT